MIKASATILVKNAQAHIKECLESLRDFDEIILLDNQSEDDTLKIAKEFNESYKNLKIYQSEFIGFGALKNLALSYATNEWIFSIDSDEVLEKECLDFLKDFFKSPPSKDIILALPRKNLYKNEWIKASGWYPDYVIRVFNKNYTKFNENIVHESVIVPKDAKIKRLEAGLKHYAFDSVSALLKKLDRYTELYAQQNKGKKQSSISKAILHGFFSFFKNYLLKKGFLSTCNALGSFFKYIKLYEMNLSPTSSLIITTYNQKERLALVLDSVKELSYLPDEVLIADDGSKEDTKELIQAYQKDFPVPLKHIWQEDKGFRLSEIRNLAIKNAKGEYIIIIDGDMILDKNFIKDHLSFAKRKVFLQASRTIIDEKDSQKILRDNAYKLAFDIKNFKKYRILALAKLIYLTSRIRANFFDKNDFIRGIRGCNMSFFKKDCEDINGFNEDFIGWGREDSEFVARFLFNKGELRRLKFGAIAYHIYHKENSRTMLDANHKIYLECVKNKNTFCKNGLEKF
ncbi:glycosyltransferase family 2 protein [Campylobacter avium]|uniref:glycosyltransferase family 2 protein n=1 Tax=Campylobacter avium TaxID=522485 RepID=UPI00248C6258|nr:glycosyltransferase [Campylobacter avium]